MGPLLRATWRAAIETVRSHLSPDDEEAVGQGIDRMKVGARLLAWPLAILGGLLLWRAPFMVQAMFTVGLFGLTLG